MPLRLVIRSEKVVGKAAELLVLAVFFQVYLFPVFIHLTETPLTMDMAFGFLHVAPIFVAACAPAGTTRVTNDNEKQTKQEISVRFMGLF
jgi:hypothetical protein